MLVRFLLEYLELPYEEKIYQQFDEWFQEDSQKEPFNQHILSNLPYLNDGGIYIYETGAIQIYLVNKANKPELLGRNAEEQVKISQFRGIILEAVTNFRKMIGLPEDEYEKKMKDLFKNEVEWLLNRLDRELDVNKFVVGENICAVDFILFELEEIIKCYDEQLFSNLKQLERHHTLIANIPQIKNYMLSNRFNSRPFYHPVRVRWC